MSSSPETKGFDSKAREAEYQALWQTCDRATRSGDYIYADGETKREILRIACYDRLERRRAQGKTMCRTNVTSMVDLHIQREVTRLRYRAPPRRMQAAVPAPNPAPNLVPFLAEPQHYNANPAAFNPAQNLGQIPYLAIPQSQHLPQVPAVPPGLDMPMHTESHTVRSLCDEVAAQKELMERLVNTLRGYHRRIVTLEGQMQQMSQERRTAAFAQPVYPIHYAMQYPLEGLNSGDLNFAMEGQVTPASQISDGNGDEDGQEGGAPLVEA
ncbi:hypothetical protein FVEN_g6023 [Fusarium venenatum]|uniref:Uncharacterized protein n=1 Tax=Fusarium venenatum TaxID=56646 RepID=A0A2L2T1E4_9HYPO|nr:uncharacterized protein FVRRES_05689 [Fusarium venenatum]KAG8356137.1 hypothetical protein FVEN_g6023 [Fusarium venenatum]KAH6992748.1 hypothetical protein EDB82DRAFT_574426 [Fusarium venenatum]CEI61253.1 unnamed protein product [Fusarium venenatum]